MYAQQSGRRRAPTSIRVESTGTDLGLLPLLAASVPSVKTLATKAIMSVISIFDPGKKREANRKNRAQFWGDTARAGSITAARRVFGGQTEQFTSAERGYYAVQWKQLVSADSALAAKATALGPLPIPEPGSDTAPMSISEADMASLQEEINAYHNVASAASPSGNVVASAQRAGMPLILGLGILGAVLVSRKRR
jgi:hypothetical protein